MSYNCHTCSRIQFSYMPFILLDKTFAQVSRQLCSLLKMTSKVRTKVITVFWGNTYNIKTNIKMQNTQFFILFCGMEQNEKLNVSSQIGMCIQMYVHSQGITQDQMY